LPQDWEQRNFLAEARSSQRKDKEYTGLKPQGQSLPTSLWKREETAPLFTKRDRGEIYKKHVPFILIDVLFYGKYPNKAYL
jgi:hypothetical protein